MCDEFKERIASALIGADAEVAGEVPDYPQLAEAVIDAMIEPTDAMLVAAFNLGTGAMPRDIWRAMVDAARS